MATKRKRKPAPNKRALSIVERIRKPSPKFAQVAACIYGKGGVGKTSLLGTMPGRGLVIDVPNVEGGTMVLHKHADRIDVLEITQWSQLTELDKFLDKGDHDYKWLAIDTVTAMQELAKRKVVHDRDIGADPHTISMQEWGKIGELNKELYYKIRRLPLHIILLAQEKLRSNAGDDGTGLEFQPDVSPASMTGLVPSMFLVGRLYTREVEDPEDEDNTVLERRLRVAPNETILAKARTLPDRPLPAVIVEPHLGKIFAYILGAEGAKVPKRATEAAVGSLEFE
jgi:phage nucleotide-binding protein